MVITYFDFFKWYIKIIFFELTLYIFRACEHVKTGTRDEKIYVVKSKIIVFENIGDTF